MAETQTPTFHATSIDYSEPLALAPVIDASRTFAATRALASEEFGDPLVSGAGLNAVGLFEANRDLGASFDAVAALAREYVADRVGTKAAPSVNQPSEAILESALGVVRALRGQFVGNQELRAAA
ncbi:MAG: hypothetical protein K1X79_09440 [Oligoflexia bacterium]|nr:hypothetical protein [Oligoflexia bacterium]